VKAASPGPAPAMALVSGNAAPSCASSDGMRPCGMLDLLPRVPWDPRAAEAEPTWQPKPLHGRERRMYNALESARLFTVQVYRTLGALRAVPRPPACARAPCQMAGTPRRETAWHAAAATPRQPWAQGSPRSGPEETTLWPRCIACTSSAICSRTPR